MFAEQADRLELIRRKSNYDGLTGLANQTFFVVQLLELLDNKDKVNSTLLLIRITDLRDAQGGSHSAASYVLIQAAAKVLTACASLLEDLCARFYDVDFALLLPCNVPARTTAEYLLATMEVACQQGRLERPAVAIGMTRLRSGQGLPELMAEVSAALKEAEASGISTIREAAPSARMAVESRQWLDNFERAITQKLVRLSGLPITSLDGKLIHSETQLEIKLESNGDWQQVRRWQPLIQELELDERVDMLAIGMALTALDAIRFLQPYPSVSSLHPWVAQHSEAACCCYAGIQHWPRAWPLRCAKMRPQDSSRLSRHFLSSSNRQAAGSACSMWGGS